MPLDHVLARAEKQRALGIESHIDGERFIYPNDGHVKPSHISVRLVEAASKHGVRVHRTHRFI